MILALMSPGCLFNIALTSAMEPRDNSIKNEFTISSPLTSKMTHFISLQTLDLISVTEDGKCKFHLSPSMSKDCDSIELTKTVLKMGT